MSLPKPLKIYSKKYTINKKIIDEDEDLYIIETHKRKIPPKPTNALPGTKEKVKVLTQRFAAGYHLYHPQDATLSLD